MDTGISKVIKDGDGNSIIYAALIGAMVANMVPTPFDAIYFSRQQKLKAELEAGKITVDRYWYQDVGEYYLWTGLWYASIIGLFAAINGSYKTNARMLIALGGAGLVVAVMFKNIQKDKEIAELAKKQTAA